MFTEGIIVCAEKEGVSAKVNEKELHNNKIITNDPKN
jgi:hypothetical protein